MPWCLAFASSSAYFMLSNAFRKQFPNSFQSVEVKSFSNGSTNAVIDSIFATNISSTELPQATEILLTITSNIVNNTLGDNLRIIPENVQVEGFTIYNISSVNVSIIFDLINYPYSVNLDNLTSPSAQNLIKEANDELEQLIGVDIKVLSVTTNSIGNNTDGMVHLDNTAVLNITTLPNKKKILNAIVQGIGNSMLLGSSNLEVPANSVIVGGLSSGIKAVPIFFKLVDETFNNELKKKKSIHFKTLSGKVLSGLTFALKNTNPMRVVLQRFRNGSVQCESLAWYSEKAPHTQDIISALEKNINKQTFILGNSSLTVNWTSFDIEGSRLPVKSLPFDFRITNYDYNPNNDTQTRDLNDKISKGVKSIFQKKFKSFLGVSNLQLKKGSIVTKALCRFL
uniref:Uncharacterized protein n=1 Tax=Eptatretus burgeri TaxID=7764 RepID=A0A8C4QNB2_EPTBU